VSALGTAARRNFYIDRGNNVLYMNHYVFLLGPTGSGKTTAIKPAQSLILNMNEHILRQTSVATTDTVTVLPEQITPQRLIQLLKHEPTWVDRGLDSQVAVFPDACGYLAADEAVTLIGKDLFAPSVMIHLLTALYTKDNFEAGTITRGDFKLHNVTLNIVLGSTLDWLREGITRDMFGGGFMGRWVFAYRGRSVAPVDEPAPLDPLMENELAQWLARLATAPRTELIRTPAAISWFKQWYRRHYELNQDETWLSGYYARKGDHLYKLAGVLTLSQGSTTITDETMRHALAILDAEERSYPAAFRLIGAHARSRIYEHVLTLLRRSASQTLPITSLLAQSYHLCGGKREFDDILTTLAACGAVRVWVDQVGKKAIQMASVVPDEVDGEAWVDGVNPLATAPGPPADSPWTTVPLPSTKPSGDS
jgi:hypothetical protein